MAIQDFDKTTPVVVPSVGLVPTLTQVFVIVGALNWGLVGLLDFDLVAFLFGMATPVTKAVYAIVGVCGVFQLLLLLKSFSRPRI